MPEAIRLRLSGDETGVRAVLAALHRMHDVDSVVELGMNEPGVGDDSSSAGLPDDTAVGAEDVEVRMNDSANYEHVQGRIETLAVGADVVVEWLGGG